MAKTNECWGIEVGTSSLKAIRLARSGGDVSVADYEIIPHKQVLTTPDIDQAEAVAVALDALTSKHDLSKSAVVVSVPGNRAFARFAKLPPVEPKKIPDIVRFEAVQQIPFPIEQVEWDYQVFQQEDSPDVEVGIFAITKDRVNEFIRGYRTQGIDVDEITLSPVGVFNAFGYEGLADDAEDGTIIMDIGGVSTDLIIVEGGGIWLRTLPIGGANFTEALVKAFKLSYAKAEKLKREAATSKYARQIFQAMRPVFSDLVQEVQKSLGYYQSLNRDAKLGRIVGLGSTFRLPGLQKFLKQQLGLDVTRPTKFNRISVEGKREADFADHAMNLATAYGLALQGLGLGRVKCNLLPTYIAQARMWKAKQPWFAAAAACLALAAGLAYFSLWSTRGEWKAAAEEVDAAYAGVVNRAEGRLREWRDITRQADPRLAIENVRGILDYRGVWAGVLRDVSDALDTIEADPAVFVADYDAIAGLPEQNRRRAYVTEIGVDYLGVTEPGGGSTVAEADLAGLVTAETIWHANATATPRFEVVVKGFIDANETAAARILELGPVRWLKNHAERPDRPYRLDASGGTISAIMTGSPPVVADDGAPPAARTTTARPRNASAEGRAVRDRTARPPRAAAADGSTRPANWAELAELLPENPMGRFVGDEVAEFVLRWQVELRSPEEARDAARERLTAPASAPVAPGPTGDPAARRGAPPEARA